MTFVNEEELHQHLIECRSDMCAEYNDTGFYLYCDERGATMHVQEHGDVYGGTWKYILQIEIKDGVTLEEIIPNTEFEYC